MLAFVKADIIVILFLLLIYSENYANYRFLYVALESVWKISCLPSSLVLISGVRFVEG